MPYISPAFIEDLEAQIDAVEVIGNFVELKKAGSVYKGLSPFSDEKTPSFVVSSAKQIFKCFSSGKGGNAIHFVMEHKSVGYPEAIEIIAGLQNMTVQYDDSKASRAALAKKEKKMELAPLMDWAALYYHKKFVSLPPDHPAKVEVYGHRRYSESMVNRWQIGYAPGHKAIYLPMVERGQKETAKGIGLITDHNDKYYERLIYPITDARGHTVGLAGRDLTGSHPAKWINPVESELYEKSKLLFGFHEAREAIAKSKTAYIVEGYNDVISSQEGGLLNTVGISGTAISLEQIRMLRKIADRLVIMADQDKAGVKFAMRYMAQLLAAGFRVYIVDSLLGWKDPDDFCRFYTESFKTHGFTFGELMQESDMTRDGLMWYMERMLDVDDALEKATRVKRMAEILAKVQDDAIVKIYTSWLVKQSDFTKSEISNWIKDEIKKNDEPKPEKRNSEDEIFEIYRLPRHITTPLEELKPTIEKYGMFQTENTIYMMAQEGPPHSFYSVSNFSIKILQHMEDEKFPMKLLRVKNVRGEEKTFDVASSEINTPQSFDKVMTDNGNYFWEGGRNELMKLRKYLYDEMGIGRKIDVMGRQDEGFWAWNNKVRVEEGNKTIDIGEDGLVEVDGVSYYVPSANKIYARNNYKFLAQKRVKVMPSPVSFQTYVEKMVKVHRQHAYSGILFTIASMFQDVVIEATKGNFPLLFLYGPPSSGKDQLLMCCQSFFGVPQEALNLEGGASTVKSKVREFAQFANIIGHLSEYKQGDAQLDGVLKALWDRVGYKRANWDSQVATDSVPIRSSCAITGNEYPSQPALISRIIPEEMIYNTFNPEEVAMYEELGDITSQGVSSLGDELLQFRSHFVKNFKKKYSAYKQGFQERMPTADSRMISNISVLGGTFHLLKDELNFPFDHNQLIDHFTDITKQQLRKLASSSVITRWWDCFLASMRGHKLDRLQLDRDLDIKNGYLYFNFTNAYNRVSIQWSRQYQELAPGKFSLAADLRKEPAFVKDAGQRIGESNTSCMIITLKEIAIHEELYNAVEWQRNEHTLFHKESSGDGNTQETKQKDMPF